MITGEKIFITGGAGYLGTALVKRYYNDNEITIFSRDEAKHYYLKKNFPKVKCIIGDIRNAKLLTKSLRGHTLAIFAASLKQIEAVDQNIEEALEVIVHGAFNSRSAAIENNLKAATFISTDKSRGPTTLYGAMKFVGGEAFILNAEQETTKLSSVIYGNVLNSTGSVIPLIWDAIQNKYTLKLYGEDMTRFMIGVEDAIDCIEYALETTGYNIIPRIQAFKVKDLFEIFEEKFGLTWESGSPRISEKMHEQMISYQEKDRIYFDKKKNIYFMHYRDVSGSVSLPLEGYSSEHHAVDKKALVDILEKNNYFKPE